MSRRTGSSASNRSPFGRDTRKRSRSYLGALLAFLAAMAIAASGARAERLAMNGVAAERDTAFEVHLVPETNPPVAYAIDASGLIVWIARWNSETHDFDVQQDVHQHSGDVSGGVPGGVSDGPDELWLHFGFK